MSPNSFFRPKARLLLILGEQLITNEIIAIVELVKNAYDADATKVNITLENADDKNEGKIIIEDNGSGMTRQIIKNVWLEPATDYKINIKRRKKRTKKFRRLPLGEKGVGRFAVHKLGNNIELVTKSENRKREIYLPIDWADFEGNQYLDEVPVTIRGRSPKYFTGASHGTRMIITGLRMAWTNNKVNNLALKLQELNPPFAKLEDFEVVLKAPGFAEALEGVFRSDDIPKTAFYSFEGTVDDNGKLTYHYTFTHPVSKEFRRKQVLESVDIRDPDHFEARKPLCGPFKIKLYALDRDPQLIKELRQKSLDIVRDINGFRKRTGVRLYRDDFRVWPYGETGDDWLKLDNRRIQNPTHRIGNGQVIGVIEISEITNPELRDKTNREGLIGNEAFEDFVSLTTGAITALEIERRKDKDEVDKWLKQRRSGQSEIKGDPVETEIDQLEGKMQKEGDFEKYEKNLDNLRSNYRTTLEETLEPLIVAAGIGVSYTLPIHELQRNLGDLQLAIREVDAILGDSEIYNVLKQIDTVIKGAEKMMKAGKKTTFNLASPVNDAVAIMKLRLERNDIDVELETTESGVVYGKRNLIVTAVLNLLDNSAYWLRLRQKGREININVGRSPTGQPRILVADNGPGIKDDPDLLLRPFFTRKPDGTGLGLHIVNRIMQAFEGTVEFLLHDKRDAATREGANVALVFPGEYRGEQ